MTESIRKLKQGKARGLDNVLAEMLKSSGALLTPFLTECFNEIFKSGPYPDTWTRAVIVPIHKKGDTGAADNYRGITLLSLLGKCYTTILNKRLYEWLEDNFKKSQKRKQVSIRDTRSQIMFLHYTPLHKNICLD